MTLDQIQNDIQYQLFTISKLRLRRKLRELGAEELLNSMLNSDPKILNDWNDAQFLTSVDDLLVSAIPLFVQATGMSEEDLMNMLWECRE